VLLLLEPLRQPFPFVMGFFEIRSLELFAWGRSGGLASNWDPPDLCLLSS
jgi:hypothetical protein